MKVMSSLISLLLKIYIWHGHKTHKLDLLICAFIPPSSPFALTPPLLSVPDLDVSIEKLNQKAMPPAALHIFSSRVLIPT